MDRLTRLDLARFFRRIYCRERANSEHPDAVSASKWLNSFPLEKVVELSHHQRKPNPEVLLEICSDEGVDARQCAYVGDSMARDVLMAKRADVFAIWAKYGASHKSEQYQKLVRVTHWTEEDVARETTLREKAREIEPDYILESKFSEIIYLLQMERKSFALS